MVTVEAERLEEIRDTKVDFEDRRIFLMEEIDDDVAEKIITVLHVLDAAGTAITLVINTPGGHEPAGYAIYDALVLAKSEIIIEGYGRVASIGAAILQAGDKRLLAPNCDVMVHNGERSGMKKTVDNNEVQRIAREIERDNDRYRQILTSGMVRSYLRMCPPVDFQADVTAIEKLRATVKNWCDEETYFTAHEAVRYGLADEVMTPKKRHP